VKELTTLLCTIFSFSLLCHILGLLVINSLITLMLYLSINLLQFIFFSQVSKIMCCDLDQDIDRAVASMRQIEAFASVIRPHCFFFDRRK